MTKWHVWGRISYGPSRANLSLYWSALSPYEAEEEENKPEPQRHCIQEFPLQTRSNISLLNSPLYLFKLICIERKGTVKVDVSSMECIPFPANKWVYKTNRGNLRNALNCAFVLNTLLAGKTNKCDQPEETYFLNKHNLDFIFIYLLTKQGERSGHKQI